MKLKTILFLDNTYPEAYQVSTLNEKAIGGTESSVIRTALILSQSYKVIVAQKSRSKSYSENENLIFLPKSKIIKYKPDYIIVLRKYNELKNIHKIFPNAQLYLWIHTYKNYEYVFKKPGLSKLNINIICNSETHKRHTDKLLKLTKLAKLLSFFYKKTPVHFCYNPIEKPVLRPIKRNINKLLFFSSPNKGLDQVIEKFKKIRVELPDLNLYIANPGYKNLNLEKLSDGIINLGSLAHSEMMHHVRESLCIFYPQEIFSETFGLIYAEAHAQETAIIAADIGSAKEIMHENNQPIDVRDIDLIVETIKKWQLNYPTVSYNEKFSNNFIYNQWQKVLG